MRNDKPKKENTIKRRVICVLLILLTSQLSCKKDGGTNDGDNQKINPNIVLVKSCCDDPFIGGDYRMGIGVDNLLYCISPGRRIKISSSSMVLEDTLLLFLGRYGFISGHRSHTFMVIRSNYPDVSSGQLLELETQTFNLRLLRDSAYNISSATYLPNENRCIYYSYGEPSRQILPGYYTLDLSTLQDNLLFQYISEIGPAEVVNGFDVSPDGTKLLFPVNRAAEPPLNCGICICNGSARDSQREF
ncbi:hypothetical protein FBQ87_04950 [Sphingobacteriales bacterium CHB3]|nr:hypothetical protein [Sphingobacteriales bacterium CHB3]